MREDGPPVWFAFGALILRRLRKGQRGARVVEMERKRQGEMGEEAEVSLQGGDVKSRFL